MLLITDGLPRGLGYVEVDNRASGMPPGKSHFEADTYTCTHCSRVVILNPQRKRDRYKCSGCNHHICDTCAGDMVAGAKCETMQQKYEKYLEQVSRQVLHSPIILP